MFKIGDRVMIDDLNNRYHGIFGTVVFVVSTFVSVDLDHIGNKMIALSALVLMEKKQYLKKKRPLRENVRATSLKLS